MLGVKHTVTTVVNTSLTKFEDDTLSYRLLVFLVQFISQGPQIELEKARTFFSAGKHNTKSSSAYFRTDTSTNQLITAHTLPTQCKGGSTVLQYVR